jgi:hypothetical protein
MQHQTNLAVQSTPPQPHLFLTPAEAGELAFGWKAQTCYNLIAKGSFPFPVVEIGGKKLVRYSDMLDFINELQPVNLKPARRRGPPTKREKIKKQSREIVS